jgi:hypothetical protein
VGFSWQRGTVDLPFPAVPTTPPNIRHWRASSTTTSTICYSVKMRDSNGEAFVRRLKVDLPRI